MGIHASLKHVAASEISRRGQVQLMPAFIYNPAWSIPGSCDWGFRSLANSEQFTRSIRRDGKGA